MVLRAHRQAYLTMGRGGTDQNADIDPYRFTAVCGYRLSYLLIKNEVEREWLYAPDVCDSTCVFERGSDFVCGVLLPVSRGLRRIALQVQASSRYHLNGADSGFAAVYCIPLYCKGLTLKAPLYRGAFFVYFIEKGGNPPQYVV